MNIPNLIRPGSTAYLGSISVTVTAVQISGNDHVQYQVSWVYNGVRNSQLVEWFELTMTETSDVSLSLGFKL